MGSVVEFSTLMFGSLLNTVYSIEETLFGALSVFGVDLHRNRFERRIAFDGQPLVTSINLIDETKIVEHKGLPEAPIATENPLSQISHIAADNKTQLCKWWIVGQPYPKILATDRKECMHTISLLRRQTLQEFLPFLVVFID